MQRKLHIPPLLYGFLAAAALTFLFTAVSLGQLTGEVGSSTGQSGQTSETEPEKTSEPPQLKALVKDSARLSADLADIESQITEVADISESKQALVQIEQALEEIRRNLETVQNEGNSHYRLLNRLQSRLDIQQEQLGSVMARIDTDLDQVQDWIDRWGRAERKWSRWQKAASDSIAYDVMQATFEQARATIDAARRQLTRNIQPLVSMQEEALRRQSRIDELQRQIGKISSAIRGDILEGAGPAVFSPRYLDQFHHRLDDRFLQGIVTAPLPKDNFFEKHAWLVGLQVVLVFTIALYFRSNPKFAEESELWILFARRYIATGVFVSFFFLSFFYDAIPVLVDLAVRTAVAIATVRLVAALFEDTAMRRLLYLLIAVFIATSFFKYITLPAPLFRLYVTAASAAGVLLALHQAGRFRKEQSARGSIWGLRFTALAFAAVFFLDVFGYSQLARYLFESLIQTLALILVAWILILFLRGCLETLVFSRPLQKFTVVASNTKAIQSKATFVVSALVIVLLVAEVLTRWKLFSSAGEAVAQFLSLGFTIGSKEVTLGLVLAAGVVLYGSFVVSWTIQSSLLEGKFSKRQVQRGVRVAMSKLIHYAVVLVGILLALSALGFELRNLTIIGGALGVGIGFGMQTIVNNFICGLILLFERPVKVGDTIEVEGTYGVVKQVGLRATVVETYDQAEIVVPNADLITEQVTNWTLAERRLRLKIPVGVAYGSGVSKVRDTLKECARDNPLILENPKPVVLFMGFGDSALNFELLCWTDDFDNRLNVISELNQEIEKRFRERDIEIPFPQRDLHLRSADTAILEPLANRHRETESSTNAENEPQN